MIRFLLRRFTFGILSVIGATFIVFVLSRLAGDPRNLYLGTGMITAEIWEQWGRDFGLDKPLPVQYWLWLRDAIQLDFGESIQTGHQAFDTISEKVPATLQLAGGAWAFALLVGIPLGVLSATKRSSAFDLIGRTFALFGQALPPFFLGLMLILVFSVQLGWLPTSQRGGWEHYILPMVTLGWLPAAAVLRMVRSSMLETLDSEYIKLARAKGVAEWKVVWKHAFKNAAIPPMTMAALILASFLTGTVVTETVFAWPGLGRLVVTAINNNDFPVMTGSVLVFTVLYVITVFVVDISYALIDPRIRIK
jgi:peptide/nickel transport system permease protein